MVSDLVFTQNVNAMRESPIADHGSRMTSPLIEYPEFFDEKLKDNRDTRAAVDLSLSLVSDVLRISKLPFFPDYTDHGPEHLAKVLEIAENLISEKSRKVFTAEDAGVLIFAVLLHDLALHLSEAGFKSLLDASPNKWGPQWREFLAVAKHWDQRKLVELFGSDEAGAPRALVRDPFSHYGNLTESDRKLVGEFIRQHHSQMAYEFAVVGFPGDAGQLIQFGSWDSELRKLSGLVARSHGLALRDCIRDLENNQLNKLEQDNVHPVFLMGVLRIADFLELGKNRAPLIAFRYKEFKSVVSQQEWEINQALRGITWAVPDAESISIPARPKDVYLYLGLKQWLTAIQSELDVTWAVFGEVYANHTKFAEFGLTIRRVHSNILDDPEFARTSLFVPRRIELGVASAEVLKLFIEPLYGKHPEIGIRELVQNAVDAVRERREFEKNHPPLGSSGSGAQEPDVVVWLDDPDENGLALLTVTDNGIGMTEETVADYFLKVGASFRRSIAWKKEFETEAGEKDQPKSRVLRSGRFGIGVLASFLLADEVEVSTRHITSERGIRFSMRLDSRPPALEIAPIQLNYDTTLPVGTTLRLKVDKVIPAAVEKKGRDTFIDGTDIFITPNLWDWYCLDAPSVLRLQGKKKKILEQSATVPAEDSALPRGWHLLRSSDYRTVHALTHKPYGIYPPDLVCNGIKVIGTMSFAPRLESEPALIGWTSGLFPWEGVLKLKTPDFSIFDPDGNLPLNLQRTGLTNLRLDFLKDAFSAQSKAALARLIASAPVEPKLPKQFLRALADLFEFHQVLPVFFTKTGTALLTATNLRIGQVKNCLLLNSEALSKDWLVHLRDKYDAVIVAQWGFHGASPLYSLNELRPWIATARLITRSDEAPRVARPLRFRYQEFSVDGFHVFRTGNCPHGFLGRADIEILRDRFLATQDNKDLQSANDFIAAELFLKPEIVSKEPPELSLGRHWEQILLEPTIPFEPAERPIKLNHAYTALQDYLADCSSFASHEE
jgi:molecular chaperone HtpG